MSKIVDNEHGVWSKTIVNTDETMDHSKDIITYVTDHLNQLTNDARIITSMQVTVDYCNTDETSLAMYKDVKSKVSDIVKDGLLIFEESEININNSKISYNEDNDTIRDKIVKYIDIIVSRGMLNEHQFIRVADVMNKIYALLTGDRDKTFSLTTIIDNMDLHYEVKYYPPTVACPDVFFKVVKVSSPLVVEMVSDQHKINRDKIDQFIKKWFKEENGKIYDKDRDEFYMEFMEMYESIEKSSTDTNEDGSITIRRRVKPKQVMGMKSMINYADINKILEKYGLNYHISYQQEVAPSEERGKRKNSLALKDNRL